MSKFADKGGPMSSSKKEEKQNKEKTVKKKNRSYMIPTDVLEKLAVMEVRSDLNRSEIVSEGIKKMYDEFQND